MSRDQNLKVIARETQWFRQVRALNMNALYLVCGGLLYLDLQGFLLSFYILRREDDYMGDTKLVTKFMNESSQLPSNTRVYLYVYKFVSYSLKMLSISDLQEASSLHTFLRGLQASHGSIHQDSSLVGLVGHPQYISFTRIIQMDRNTKTTNICWIYFRWLYTHENRSSAINYIEVTM